MKQKTSFKNLVISVSADISAHEWPIYQYRPQKSPIGRSLIKTHRRIICAHKRSCTRNNQWCN